MYSYPYSVWYRCIPSNNFCHQIYAKYSTPFTWIYTRNMSCHNQSLWRLSWISALISTWHCFIIGHKRHGTSQLCNETFMTGLCHSSDVLQFHQMDFLIKLIVIILPLLKEPWEASTRCMHIERFHMNTSFIILGNRGHQSLGPWYL